MNSHFPKLKKRKKDISMKQDTIFKKRTLGNSKYDSKDEKFNALNNKMRIIIINKLIIINNK